MTSYRDAPAGMSMSCRVNLRSAGDARRRGVAEVQAHADLHRLLPSGRPEMQHQHEIAVALIGNAIPSGARYGLWPGAQSRKYPSGAIVV